MKRVWMVFVVMTCVGLFSLLLLDSAYAAINLASVGKEAEVYRTSDTFEPAISLDGVTLPKGVYYADVSVVVYREATLEEGVEIQFETVRYKLGFFVEGNVKMEKGVFLHSVNSQGEEPKWLGLQVMPKGRLEADDLRIEGIPDEQPVWMLILGTAVIRNSEISRVRVSDYIPTNTFGNLTLEKCTINGLSFSTTTTIKARDTAFKLAHPDGYQDTVHALAYLFNGQADFSDNNQWEGGSPTFLVWDGKTYEEVRDANKLEGIGIKTKPPTAVESMSWGFIKKLLMH